MKKSRDADKSSAPLSVTNTNANAANMAAADKKNNNNNCSNRNKEKSMQTNGKNWKVSVIRNAVIKEIKEKPMQAKVVGGKCGKCEVRKMRMMRNEMR